MALERKTPMPRGKALTTRAPLAAGKGLARGKPLTARAPIARTPVVRAPTELARARERAPRAAPARPVARSTGPSARTRADLSVRDGARCARCGGPATNVQHRLARGAGGAKGARSQEINGMAWLVSVCGQGSVSGCHGVVEADRHLGEREGYRIARNGPGVDAATVPVLTFAGWVLLDDRGGRTPCASPVGGDARNGVRG